jgi:periplasmic divalent cation tolerance protein
MRASTREGEPGVNVIFVTVPDLDTGMVLARRLVQEGLVACGNVIPGLTSVYRWNGEIQEDPEALLVLKTTAEAIERLERRVDELHPYDVPEFLVLPVSGGSDRYLRWVVGEVGDSEVSR